MYTRSVEDCYHNGRVSLGSKAEMWSGQADRASQVSAVAGLIAVTQGRSGMRWSPIMDGEETQWWGKNMTKAHGD